ncbi:MAG: hypothetical protein LH474_14110 [Chamaesiphon sp.]|nr:hypothetical protein [Chamaesiphon sp.]
MQNSKRQKIGNQLVSAWKKFQPRQKSGSRKGNQTEVDQSDPLRQTIETGETIAHPGEDPQPKAVNKRINIPSRDLFNEMVAPISKLNLPTVHVEPWSAFWAVLTAMVGGTGITSYLLLIAVPPTPNCQGVLPLSVDSERLYCAQVGAETKEVPKLRSAVNLVQNWTDSHPLYAESQRLLKSWSEDLIRIGRKQVNEGNIQQAIATLKIVPITSPIYDLTQETITKWSIQAQDSSKIDDKFEQAMKSGEWNQAFAVLQSVQRMKGSYWSSYKYDQMASKLAKERDGWDRLQEAKDALEAKDGDDYNVRAKRIALAVKAAAKKQPVVEAPLPKEPAPILNAMKLANQIDKSTYVYQEGQTLRAKWSKHLIDLSVDLYKAQNFNEAISIAQKVPQDVSSYAEAQDWVKLNQAHVWAGKRHILALMDAIAQAKKIPKTSTIYTLARTKQSNWQGMLKQQTQLQWARTIASFQQPATLALAIQTAKQVPAQSEVGQTIQSEMSTWSQQIETVDNRILLVKARQIVSNSDSLANLRAAVKLTGKITKDRPMGEEITASVAEWTEKIQVIEDRPILAQAIETAKQGHLFQAITVASRITAGRSLYPDAQSQIRYWSLTLQEIADRRTLDRAIATYRKGNISNAINLAATISRSSPIYDDARVYISNWRLLLAPRSVRN